MSDSLASLSSFSGKPSPAGKEARLPSGFCCRPAGVSGIWARKAEASRRNFRRGWRSTILWKRDRKLLFLFLQIQGPMPLPSLRKVFFGLSLASVIFTAWYMVVPSHNVAEYNNWMYFYDYEPIHKQDFLFTLRERSKCEDNNPFLIILVTSRPTDVRVRQAIRVTWGSQRSWWGNQVLTLFLLGKGAESDDPASLSIEDESILYGDIIQQDFIDTYNNLSLKTIMAFRWVTEFCSSAKYVMKADSDVFINTGNLVKFLLNLNASENFITGYPLVNSFSYRGFYKKTYISYTEYPFRRYPPYLSGLGYVFDTRLAAKVYKMMAHVKPIKFEDVYVGICLNILGVNISIAEDKELFYLYRIGFDVCKFKHLIAVHGVSPQEMVFFWQEITRETSLLCQ
uniref:UDP-GalNAc:beta-1, 3-N-acetylgalactosaminyltransferase 1 isoform X3 n=1 Tax=Podarcis muralis TaxID=64176 RepID=UPI0010A02F41|nr:UDP-GalNAc:beta-1,3-N-acetylgalactosaminyltransferase 1 isoform X3 [Podarcis muralis]